MFTDYRGTVVGLAVLTVPTLSLLGLVSLVRMCTRRRVPFEAELDRLVEAKGEEYVKMVLSAELARLAAPADVGGLGSAHSAPNSVVSRAAGGSPAPAPAAAPAPAKPPVPVTWQSAVAAAMNNDPWILATEDSARASGGKPMGLLPRRKKAPQTHLGGEAEDAEEADGAGD